MDEYKGIYFNETNELKFYEGGAHFRYIDLVNVLEDIKAKNVFKQRNAKSMTAVRNKNNNEGIINSGSNCKMKYQSRNIHPLIQSLTQKLSEITNKQKQEEIHINKKVIGNNNSNSNNNNKLLIVHQRQTSKIDNVNSSSCVSHNDIKHKASRNQIKNGNVINSINTCNTALTLGKNTINKQMWKKTICSNNNNNNNNNNNHPIVNKIKVNYSISESQYNLQKKSTTMIINNERSRNKQLQQQHQHQPSHQIIHPNNHPKTSLLHLTKTNPTHKDVFIQNLSFIKPTSTVIHKKHTPDKQRRNKSIGDITVNRDKAYLNQNNSCNSNNIKMDNSTITNSHHHNQRTFSMHNEISLLSSDLNTSNRGSTTVVVNNNDKHFPFNINQINTVNNNNNNIIVKPRINISFVNNINTKSRNKTANKNHSNGKTINVNRDATRLHGGGNSVSNKYNTLFKTNNSLKGICSVNANNNTNNSNKAVSPLGKGKKRVVSGVKMNYHGKSNSGYGGNNVNMNMNRNGSDVGKVSIECEILAKGMKGNYAKLSEIILKRKKKEL